MLSDLFVRSFRHAQASPHSADLEAFAQDLKASGYSFWTARRHVRRLHVVLSTARVEPAASMSPEQLRLIFADRPRKAYTGTRRLYGKFLQARGRLLPSLALAEPRFALKNRYLQRPATGPRLVDGYVGCGPPQRNHTRRAALTRSRDSQSARSWFHPSSIEPMPFTTCLANSTYPTMIGNRRSLCPALEASA